MAFQSLMKERPVAYRGQLPKTPACTTVDTQPYTTAETSTVQTGITSVIITADADSWIRFGGASAVPSSDVIDGTGAIFLAKGVRYAFDIPPAQTISFVSVSGTAHASIEKFSA